MHLQVHIHFLSHKKWDHCYIVTQLTHFLIYQNLQYHNKIIHHSFKCQHKISLYDHPPILFNQSPTLRQYMVNFTLHRIQIFGAGIQSCHFKDENMPKYWSIFIKGAQVSLVVHRVMWAQRLPIFRSSNSRASHPGVIPSLITYQLNHFCQSCNMSGIPFSYLNNDNNNTIIDKFKLVAKSKFVIKYLEYYLDNKVILVSANYCSRLNVCVPLTSLLKIHMFKC